ncbi:MAG TPA: DUF4345 domain-containing protein [Cyclobacteriaceae bacterium]|nr:DUF4345 domain-containing protein [Cyclobacteriaceae bacterium]HMV09171.1 DUF4345 domain-containing protein [Cyclobacteriaceae bacterium]HMV91588.1 DUF4345 domain-containing protein [Cyclobacteriaceae bacterium]HMX01460.1 DUF4345 domain-containing protein [Cyclobacteriaceae bacterium]HMX50270.1 DUF4345 domain-containing protein [Cyclobacteriaceae bacterium]
MIVTRISQVFLALLALAFCKTGIEALINPQAVLANVGIDLNSPAALSSMRAVYGGMHLMFGLFCVGGIFKNQSTALLLVILYTAGFVTGRIVSWIADGTPNEFVITWLATETFSLVGCTLLLFLIWNKKRTTNP